MGPPEGHRYGNTIETADREFGDWPEDDAIRHARDPRYHIEHGTVINDDLVRRIRNLGVTRTDSKGNVWGPRQRISVEEALRVGTLHGAYASYDESLKGSIEPGKLADCVVLGSDPTRPPPSSLIRFPVERTMVGGRWVSRLNSYRC